MRRIYQYCGRRAGGPARLCLGPVTNHEYVCLSTQWRSVGGWGGWGCSREMSDGTCARCAYVAEVSSSPSPRTPGDKHSCAQLSGLVREAWPA